MGGGINNPYVCTPTPNGVPVFLTIALRAYETVQRRSIPMIQHTASGAPRGDAAVTVQAGG